MVNQPLTPADKVRQVTQQAPEIRSATSADNQPRGKGRADILQFRVTPQEKLMIQEQADKLGIAISQYVRMIVRKDLGLTR
jgi:hypothetical protein